MICIIHVHVNLPIIRDIAVVNLDESDAVDEEMGAKRTLHDKLRPVLKLGILLLQNLHTKENVKINERSTQY